jgi:hypothetical protein
MHQIVSLLHPSLAVMAYGGQVPKMQEGGEVPTKTAQRMTSIAEMLKTLRES